MQLAQRGGSIPDSKQGIMEVTGDSVEAIASEIEAFTSKYLVRLIDVAMVYVPMVPASAFGANAIFASTVTEGETDDASKADNPEPYQAVVIFEEETR